MDRSFAIRSRSICQGLLGSYTRSPIYWDWHDVLLQNQLGTPTLYREDYNQAGNL
jgi:hypothetical protein